MNIFIATDITIRICQGKVYARSKYSTILRRYYNAFGLITLCSRVEEIDQLVDDCVDISDIVKKTITISSLMNMLLGKQNKAIIDGMRECDLVICRCPSISAYRAADCAKKLNIPFFAESMGCAWDAYWNHGLSGKIIAPYMFFKMKQVVKNADYALYVTSEFLQKRYPRKKSSVAASNVLIKDVSNDIMDRRIDKIKATKNDEIILMTTAAVNVKYKGQQYVIDAIPKLNQVGIRVKYYIVGEGNQDYLKSIAQKKQVEDQVVFSGRLPLDDVFNLLDETDIYIQPSLQEGLPRSVIEAMSRGCLAIGARTAGIPELLLPKYVVSRKSSSEIANTIIDICSSAEEEKIKVAQRNFAFAKEFLAPVLDERRNKYYEMIKTRIGVN